MKPWFRSFRANAPRMAAFWFLVIMSLALAGWSALTLRDLRLAAEFRATAIQGEALIVAQVRNRQVPSSGPWVYRVTVAYEAAGQMRRQTVNTQLSNLRRPGPDPDRIRIAWLPRDPGLVELGNERRTAPWARLPVLALLLVLVVLPALSVWRNVGRAAR